MGKDAVDRPRPTRCSHISGQTTHIITSREGCSTKRAAAPHWQMMRRNMAVIKENVYESVAKDSLVRKEKKRSSRSELEIVKTQEKFGTKHQRPCALCEQSFSEVNLVLAVPFKVW